MTSHSWSPTRATDACAPARPFRSTASRLWDPRTGEAEVTTTYEGGRDATTVPLELDPYETVAIVFSVRNTLGATMVLDEPGTVELTGRNHGKSYRGEATVRDRLQPIPVDGPWTVQLEREGESPRTTELGSWTVTDPGFSGSAVYRTSVDLTGSELGDRRLMLDLGEDHDVAQVTVNGAKLPRQQEPAALGPARSGHAPPVGCGRRETEVAGGPLGPGHQA